MAIHRLYHYTVFVEEQRPRFVLPDDVPPATGMTREEFNAWALSTCGWAPMELKDGQILRAGTVLQMNINTWRNIKENLEVSMNSDAVAPSLKSIVHPFSMGASV